MGFVFQKANLIPFLNAMENVALAMEINDTAPRAPGNAPWNCSIISASRDGPEPADGPLRWSATTRRRRPCVGERTSLILADEPTAALDSHRGRQVMELFRKVAHERGSAVIVVTHDHRALDVFDRTYEMEDGQLRPATAAPVS